MLSFNRSIPTAKAVFKSEEKKMKKKLRILLVAISVLVLACAIAVGVLAADDGVSAQAENPWQYVTSSGETKTAATFAEAVKGAGSGKTVTLLSDCTEWLKATFDESGKVTSDSSIVISKALTVDLGGHTYKMVQEHQSRISITTTGLVTIKNGTIVASGNSVFGANNSGYAIIRPDTGNTNITLENLNTYSGCVIHSGWVSGTKVNIIGGEHHLIYNAGHCMGGGLVESRRNADVTVTGAKIFVANGRHLMSSMIYGETSSTKSSKYVFNDCDIISTSGTTSLISYANPYSDITFSGCNVYGNIAPTVNTYDAEKGYTTIPDGVIKLTGGTKYSAPTGAELPSCVTAGAGDVIGNIFEASMLQYNKHMGSLYFDATNGSINDISFYTINTQITNNYLKIYGASEGATIIYEFFGKDFHTEDINYALQFSEGYIKLASDYVLDPTAINGAISRDITFDLNGYTLTVREAEGTDAPIYIGSGAHVTVKNGILVAQEGTKYTNVYSIFEAAGDNVTLTVTDLITRVGSLINNGSYKGLTVNINGGEHNATDAPVNAIGGYVQTNAGITLNANGATIITDKDTAVASVIGKEKAQLSFVDCIVAESSASAPTKNFEYLNEYTEMLFDNCTVYGIINPVPHESDTAGAMKNGSIKMTGATRISDPSEYIQGGAITTDTDKVFVAESVKQAIKYTLPTGTLRTVNAPLTHVVASPSSDAVASYVAGAITVETSDLKSAISLAPKNTVIVLFKDVTLVESEKNFSKFENDVTLDLAGYTLKLIQKGEAHFGIYANVTIKNGSLMAAMDSTASAAGKSYPMLCYGISQKGLTLTLDNVNTYGGSMVFAWNCSDHTLNVNGGVHVMNNSGTGNDNGWLDVRGDFVLNASGAKFVTNGKSWVVSALSYKDTDTSKLDSYFNFTNCVLVSENGKSNLIGYANEYSHFTFDGCDIYGAINPTLNLNDQNAGIGAIKSGAIVIGSKTRMSTLADNIGGGVIVAAPSLSFVDRATFCYVKHNSYTVNAAGELDLASKVITANFTTVALSDEDAMFTVTFYAEDGVTVIATFKVAAGSTVTPPSYTAKGSNGYFNASYSGWTATFGSTAKVSDFTVYSDMAYYPAVSGTITPNFTAGYYNLTLVGKIRNNLYIPRTNGGAKLVGVYDSEGNRISGVVVTIDGAQYNMYMVGEVGAAELSRDTVITVKFSVDGVEYAYNVTLNAAKYAKNVLDNSTASKPAYTSETYTLVADLVRYSNSLAVAMSGKDDATLKALLDSYGALCSDLPADVAFTNYVANTTDLAGVIASIQLEVSSMEPRWRFNIANGVSVKDITITVKGYLPKIVDGVNYGTVTYTATAENGGKVFYTENIPMYNLDRLMTIEVTLANGNKVSGTYNLDAYFSGFEYVSEEDEIKTFLKAFRAFAVTSAGYKYGDIVMDEKTGESFFECEHKDLGAFYFGRGRFCSDCGTNIFFYSDYGAVADGVSDQKGNGSGTNDYMSLYNCHTAANAYRSIGAKVAVMAVGGAHSKTSFYIGAPDNMASILVKTDVQLSGATFIVDDRTVKQDRGDYELPVFKVERDYTQINVTGNMPNGIKEGATNIGFAPGAPMLIKLTDHSQWEYIREGANNTAGTGVSIAEVIIVDEYGNVNSTTPVQHTFTNVPYCKYGCAPVDAGGDGKCDTCGKSIVKSFSAVAYRIDDTPITINGLDKNGNINFVWENITDDQVDVSSYDQCQRVIKVERSNVTVQGIDRVFTEDDDNTTPRQTYAGIVNTQYCNNIVIKDMLVYQHLGHYIQENGKNTSVSLGSYEFSGANTCNISWINCQVKNFFWDDGSITYRGLFGTNYMRNMYFKDCFLNSMDSHSGAYNVTMEDCTFEHINYVGGGDIIMKNITVYTSKNYRMAIHLRQDYGAHWKGNVYMDGIRIRYNVNDSISSIDLIKAYYTNFNFGMETYLPINVYANNITTEGYKRTSPACTFANGTIIDENITETNKKSISIYENINSQMKNDYDYSTVNSNNQDAKHCTENIYLSNIGPSIVYPDHRFFRNMKVYIDGVEKTDWYVKRSGLCADKNGDKACDNCGEKTNCSQSHPTSGTSSTTCSGCGYTIRSNSCVTGDTLITLADGTQKRIDMITENDILLVWDFFKGEYAYAPAAIIFRHDIQDNVVIKLTFDDGTVVKVVNMHLFLNAETNEFIYVDKNSAGELIGTSFVKMTGEGYTTVKLVDYEVTTEHLAAYGIISGLHYNIITEGLISQDFEVEDEKLFNCIEIGAGMKYDEEKLAADIEAYGLYTYEEFSEYLTYEQFVAFNVQYMKIAVGKGYYTYDMIIALIDNYLNV